MVKVGDYSFEIIENNREAFNEEEFVNLFTEYFYDYDYIVGDYAYNKLRLKGFYDDNNKKSKSYNKISGKNAYIESNCAYNCKYFVLRKI